MGKVHSPVTNLMFGKSPLSSDQPYVQEKSTVQWPTSCSGNVHSPAINIVSRKSLQSSDQPHVQERSTVQWSTSCSGRVHSPVTSLMFGKSPLQWSTSSLGKVHCTVQLPTSNWETVHRSVQWPFSSLGKSAQFYPVINLKLRNSPQSITVPITIPALVKIVSISFFVVSFNHAVYCFFLCQDCSAYFTVWPVSTMLLLCTMYYDSLCPVNFVSVWLWGQFEPCWYYTLCYTISCVLSTLCLFDYGVSLNHAGTVHYVIWFLVSCQLCIYLIMGSVWIMLVLCTMLYDSLCPVNFVSIWLWGQFESFWYCALCYTIPWVLSVLSLFDYGVSFNHAGTVHYVIRFLVSGQDCVHFIVRPVSPFVHRYALPAA